MLFLNKIVCVLYPWSTSHHSGHQNKIQIMQIMFYHKKNLNYLLFGLKYESFISFYRRVYFLRRKPRICKSVDFFLIGWFILGELRNYIFCFFRCILPVKSRDCGQIKILGLILWYIGLFWVHRYLIIISVNPEKGCIGFNNNKESIAIKLIFKLPQKETKCFMVF